MPDGSDPAANCPSGEKQPAEESPLPESRAVDLTPPLIPANLPALPDPVERLTAKRPNGSRAAATPDAAARPDIPGFEILEELGRGGMGIVYRALQKSLNRQVAVKMILTGENPARRETERFLAEAEAIAGLDHPNIVQVYDFGEHHGRPFLISELVGGGNLADTTRGVPQGVEEAARTVELLARAVEYIHQHGILHRDLKPANVLLGVDGAPKIADFGLAKRLRSDDQLTQTGMVMGTPGYMAPEQTTGQSEQGGGGRRRLRPGGNPLRTADGPASLPRRDTRRDDDAGRRR